VEFATNRDEAQAFLTRKWNKELDYRLIKELWAFTGNRIAVRYAYEYRDDSGQWFRAYGNENWEFSPDGLMQNRHASINEMPIREEDRKFRWPLGRRPMTTLRSAISAFDGQACSDRPRLGHPRPRRNLPRPWL
jgi:nuclear transport factor 2 (NTF2) superfamily protein